MAQGGESCGESTLALYLGGEVDQAVEEAARTAGIGVSTLLRWLKLPEFNGAYREARRAAFGQATARLQQATSAAATTLFKIMVDPSAPASTRVRAAESILNHAAKAIEVEDIESNYTPVQCELLDQS